MAGGSWKVAYADFMTAMMAFFLLMWLLNATTEEQKNGLADYFTPNATKETNVTSPIKTGESSTQYVDKFDTRTSDMSQVQETNLAIMQALKDTISNDSPLANAAGMTSSTNGVMMTLTPTALFKPGSVELGPEAIPVLHEVVTIMNKYKVYLVVRGNADKSENTTASFPSVWELSSARATAVVEYLVQQGITPARMRAIAYGDTKPLVPPNLPGAVEQNGRVEFNFHRPEVMSTVGSF